MAKKRALPSHAQLVLITRDGVVCDSCKRPIKSVGCQVRRELLCKRCWAARALSPAPPSSAEAVPLLTPEPAEESEHPTPTHPLVAAGFIDRETVLWSVTKLPFATVDHLSGCKICTVNDVLFRAARLLHTRLADRISATLTGLGLDVASAQQASDVLTPIGLALGEVDEPRPAKPRKRKGDR